MNEIKLNPGTVSLIFLFFYKYKQLLLKNTKLYQNCVRRCKSCIVMWSFEANINNAFLLLNYCSCWFRRCEYREGDQWDPLLPVFPLQRPCGRAGGGAVRPGVRSPRGGECGGVRGGGGGRSRVAAVGGRRGRGGAEGGGAYHVSVSVGHIGQHLR